MRRSPPAFCTTPGKLVLASALPELYQHALQLASDELIPQWQAEANVFGVSHAEIGAYLSGPLGLPPSIVEAVAWHHQPRRHEPPALGVLAAVHIADYLKTAICRPAGVRWLCRSTNRISSRFISSTGSAMGGGRRTAVSRHSMETRRHSCSPNGRKPMEGAAPSAPAATARRPSKSRQNKRGFVAASASEWISTQRGIQVHPVPKASSDGSSIVSAGFPERRA